MSIAGREVGWKPSNAASAANGFTSAAGAVGLIILVFYVSHLQPARNPPAPPPRPVSVAKVITQDVPLYLDEIGTCAAYETVQVQAQVSGQIVARHFKDGADVKKGDLLFTIDKRPYQAALDAAKADQHAGAGKL